MKKIFSTILMCLGLLTAVSCVEDQLVTVNPGDIKAPVLNELTGSPYVLDEDSQFDTFSFSTANFGYQGAVQYTLYAYLDDITKAKKLAQTTSPATSITIAAKDLNNVLIGYECPADEEVTVMFVVVAQAYGESGVVVGVDEQTSNAVAATVVPYQADKVYEKIFVRGTFNGWNADANHTLSCYAEDGHTYNGIIDFGEDRDGLKFKFADANWGDINLGSSDATPESPTLTLDDGGADIPLYGEFRYYGFTVDVTGHTAKKDWAFNSLSVIGAVAGTSWDTDFDMTWNGYNKRFYVDLSLTAGDEFKFRLNHDWGQNWGVDWVSGGDNIKVEEGGNYRLYVHFDNYNKEITYALDAKMYGQPDENIVEEPVVDTFEGWSLIGMINGSNWDADVNMTENDGIFTAVAKVEGEFKIRKDHDWAVNRGGVFTAFGEPFEAVDGGSNINVGEAIVMVVYDSVKETITVTDVTGSWSLIGAIDGSSWDRDFWMTESNGIWKSEAVTISGEFKIRQNGAWDVNRGAEGDEAVEVELDKPVAVVGGGANLKAPAEGLYYLVYDPANEQITLSGVWSVIGDFNGWGADLAMTYEDGLWKSAPFTSNGGFKIRFAGSWDVNLGGSFTEFGAPIEGVAGGDNINPGEGTFVVVYDPKAGTITINKV